MYALRYRFNANGADLIDGEKPQYGVVPVLKADGSFERLKWAGFIEAEDARKIADAKPVRLDIHMYSVAPGPFPKWRDIPQGQAVLDCLTRAGVYAVVEDGMPRFVPKE
jgi:hypothetical protein